ncbi:MAG TPA: DUF5916 domain-containing protein [Gemmatimonadales bacterium]|nr:DUF5916 domain-containing protein [Gemmatimonadales bacterium]
MLAPLLLALLQAPADPRPVYNGRLRQLDVAIPRRDTTVAIDGRLDEPVWQQAALLDGFSQYRPVDGRPAEDSTQVLVWYSGDAVYFGIRAYEGHGRVVRATLADRDNIDADDRVQLLLDTYDDHRRAWLFAVNPLGIQEDGVWSDGVEASAGGPQAGGRFDATIDLNPDYVYQSRGRVTDWGYEVEIRIPFKSLRYQSADPQHWGFQVVRVIQHSGYEDTWTPAVRANASFLIQSGRFSGLTQMHRGLVMDATPEVTAKVNGAPGASKYVYKGGTDVGGTLRWGVTENLSLSATANPDFSQVEADVGQVTANQRFPLFFPEKRPFFLEGLEQYDTPNRLIYTRRMTQPLAGVKLTGKVGTTNIAYLGSVDDRSESATGDNPIYNLLRVRRDLGASSTVGLVYTDRVEGSAYNRVLGSDFRVIWKKLWFTQLQAVESWTRDAAGARAGLMWDATLFDRTGRSYGNHGELQGVSPDFSTMSGFVPRVDMVVGRFFNRFSWYGRPGALVEQFSTFTGIVPLWRYDDFFKAKSTIEGDVETQWTANLRGGWGANMHIADAEQVFDPRLYAGYTSDSVTPFVVPHGLYGLWSVNGGINTPNRALVGALNLGYGAVPIFVEAARGRQVNAAAEITWRPTTAIRIDALWQYQRITRARDGSRESIANIPRLKLEYQVTRDIFFRYVGQYFAQQRAALVDPRTGLPLVLDATATARVGPSGDVKQNDFRSDFLFSYKPTPGTVFFLGYGASLAEPDAFQFQGLKRSGDGFFLKLSYLFRM